MLIKMLKTANGGKGVFLTGKKYTVDDEFGNQLIEGKAAIKLEEPKKDNDKELSKTDIAIEKLKKRIANISETKQNKKLLKGLAKELADLEEIKETEK